VHVAEDPDGLGSVGVLEFSPDRRIIEALSMKDEACPLGALLVLLDLRVDSKRRVFILQNLLHLPSLLNHNHVL